MRGSSIEHTPCRKKLRCCLRRNWRSTSTTARRVPSLCSTKERHSSPVMYCTNCTEHAFITLLPLDRSLGDVYTIYVCRTAEVRHLKHFIACTSTQSWDRLCCTPSWTAFSFGMQWFRSSRVWLNPSVTLPPHIIHLGYVMLSVGKFLFSATEHYIPSSSAIAILRY
jgi:hypothetical protein